MYRKTRNFIFSLLALSVLNGCSSTDPLASVKFRPPDPLSNLRHVTTHSQKEVLTRQWQDRSGPVMVLLDFSIEEVKGRRLAIAKYGDKATSRAYCVDVYEYRRILYPSEVVLFLLLHDYRPGWIDNLQIERKDSHAFFNFSRKFVDPDDSKTYWNGYSYRFEPKTGFSETMGDFYNVFSK